MEEVEGWRPPVGMDDVTARIAFAYAKAEVFFWFGLTALLGGVLTQAFLLSNAALFGAQGLVAALGAALLVAGWLEKDLKRIARTGRYLTLLAALVELLLAVATHWSLAQISAPPQDVGAQLGLGAAALAVVLTYPLPVRKGGTVLFSPQGVRVLADRRLLGMVSLFWVLVGAIALILAPSADHRNFLPPWATDAAVLAWGAVGGALFLFGQRALEKGLKGRLVAVVALVGALLAALASLNAWLGADGQGDAVALFAGGLSACAVVLALSARLNSGRTIVDRRA